MSGDDERAIETVIRRFARLNDEGQWTALAELFTEDAVFARPSAPDQPIAGRAAILAAFRARPPRLVRHLVCNTMVTMAGADAAEAFSYSLLVSTGPAGASLAVGEFRDRLVRDGRAWKFAARFGRTTIDGLAFASQGRVSA